MQSKNFIPGFILKATKRERDKGFHPIVYVEGHSDTDFIGAMITHSDMNGINVKMEKQHFHDGNEVIYDNSHLVKGQFIKPNDWGPFDKVGELTDLGLAFVKDQIADCRKETFDDYFRRTNE